MSVSASLSPARSSRSARSLPSPSIALPASCAPTFGGTRRFETTPTAAPTRVSLTRCQAAESAASDPTPSTSIALIGTSTRFAPIRSTWPIRIDTAIMIARLHQVRSTKVANSAATDTPVTTLSTRSAPLASRLTGVSCTTSRAVSGASSGSVCGKRACAAT